MSRTLLNFVVDALLLVLVCSLLFSAAVLRFVFPPPTSSSGWTLWGYDFDDWANLEAAQVAVLGLAILLHIMLHWSWVCGVMVTKVLRRSSRAARPDDGTQTLWGVGMLIVVLNILAGLVGLASLWIRPPG